MKEKKVQKKYEEEFQRQAVGNGDPQREDAGADRARTRSQWVQFELMEKGLFEANGTGTAWLEADEP